MAIALLSHEVCDLTLGKPSLSWLAASASVRAALLSLKRQDDVAEISVWDCAPGSHALLPSHGTTVSAVEAPIRCKCIGKICMQKIICYLASEHNLSDVANALDAPVTVLLDEPLNGSHSRVQHIDPDASLQEALAVINGGAQNLVVQITGPLKKHGHLYRGSVSQKHFYNKKSMANALVPKNHNGHEYCWLTHEDVLRFLLGSIGVFSPLPLVSIKDLGIIQTDVMTVGVDDEAISALEMIKMACLNSTAVAVVESTGAKHVPLELVGEISGSAFQSCNESAAIALATLSVGDFLAYLRGVPDMSMDAMLSKLHKKVGSFKGNKQQELVSKVGDVSQMLHDLEMWELSSDDEFGANSPTGPHDLHKYHHIGHFHVAGRAKSQNGFISCRPTSSLIAVLMQALAHRERYIWVTHEDNTLVGMVTFIDILGVLSNHLNLMS